MEDLLPLWFSHMLGGPWQDLNDVMVVRSVCHFHDQEHVERKVLPPSTGQTKVVQQAPDLSAFTFSSIITVCFSHQAKCHILSSLHSIQLNFIYIAPKQ